MRESRDRKTRSVGPNTNKTVVELARRGVSRESADSHWRTDIRTLLTVWTLPASRLPIVGHVWAVEYAGFLRILGDAACSYRPTGFSDYTSRSSGARALTLVRMTKSAGFGGRRGWSDQQGECLRDVPVEFGRATLVAAHSRTRRPARAENTSLKRTSKSLR